MSSDVRIEMLCVGDELLDGRVVDTNSVFLGRALTELGRNLALRATVPDDVAAIVTAAQDAVARGAQRCVVSGGLGPTADDLTAVALAKLGGVELVRDSEQVAVIEARLQRRGRSITDNQCKQAERPVGSAVVPNPVGTAPGFVMPYRQCQFVALPGVPREFEAMVGAAVVDPLRDPNVPLCRHTLRTFGLLEAEVDARLKGVAEKHPAVRLGYRAKFPEIFVSLSAPSAGRTDFERAVAEANALLGKNAFGDGKRSLPEVLLEMLRQRGATLAVAESCTGGRVGDMLTNVPGSSDVFRLGVVAYANAAKVALLGVPPETLAGHGAVSEETVLAMARGAAMHAGSTFALATTGVAGPGGGTPAKPVGTTWIAAVGPDLVETRQLSLPFDRRGNKVVAAYAVLDHLRRWLSRNG